MELKNADGTAAAVVAELRKSCMELTVFETRLINGVYYIAVAPNNNLEGIGLQEVSFLIAEHLRCYGLENERRQYLSFEVSGIHVSRVYVGGNVIVLIYPAIDVATKLLADKPQGEPPWFIDRGVHGSFGLPIVPRPGYCDPPDKRIAA